MSSYTYHHDETLIGGAQRILLDQAGDALALLTDQSVDPDSAVHEVRKLFKRARATLRLLRDVIGEDDFSNENVAFRDAGRLLAAVRDSAVLVETLDLLPTAPPPELKAKLEARHERFRTELLEEQDRRSDAVALVTSARGRIADWTPQATDRKLFKGLRRVYKRGYRGMRRAIDSGSPEDYHEWRKRVKYLWYHLEMLHPIWPQLFIYWVEELHLLSDLLGDAHDLHVLRETVADEKLLDDRHQVETLEEQIGEIESELLAKARTIGVRLFAQPVDGFTSQIAAGWQAWQQADEALLNLAARRLMAEQLLDSSSAAELCRLPVETVRQMAKEEQLTAFKVGDRWIFVRSMLKEAS